MVGGGLRTFSWSCFLYGQPLACSVFYRAFPAQRLFDPRMVVPVDVFAGEGLGAADVFLETERKVSRMFSLEERSRAVELYLTTPMTTAQVVECLGYPTRQCLERWLAMDPRYAGRMAKPIIPLETRRKAIELVLGGMQQKQAAKQLGVSVGAVHNWVRAYRRGGMAALQPRNQNAAQGGKSASVLGAGRMPGAAMTWRRCAVGSRSWSWRTR